jgi:hypothetical protein
MRASHLFNPLSSANGQTDLARRLDRALGSHAAMAARDLGDEYPPAIGRGR